MTNFVSPHIKTLIVEAEIPIRVTKIDRLRKEVTVNVRGQTLKLREGDQVDVQHRMEQK